MLAWLNSEDDPSVLESLGGFHVCMSDFERALENVQPSAKREGFATVPDVSWKDIGALSDVRQELEWSILVSVLFLFVPFLILSIYSNLILILNVYSKCRVEFGSFLDVFFEKF